MADKASRRSESSSAVAYAECRSYQEKTKQVHPLTVFLFSCTARWCHVQRGKNLDSTNNYKKILRVSSGVPTPYYYPDEQSKNSETANRSRLTPGILRTQWESSALVCARSETHLWSLPVISILHFYTFVPIISSRGSPSCSSTRHMIILTPYCLTLPRFFSRRLRGVWTYILLDLHLPGSGSTLYLSLKLLQNCCKIAGIYGCASPTYGNSMLQYTALLRYYRFWSFLFHNRGKRRR